MPVEQQQTSLKPSKHLEEFGKRLEKWMSMPQPTSSKSASYLLKELNSILNEQTKCHAIIITKQQSLLRPELFRQSIPPTSNEISTTTEDYFRKDLRLVALVDSILNMMEQDFQLKSETFLNLINNNSNSTSRDSWKVDNTLGFENDGEVDNVSSTVWSISPFMDQEIIDEFFGILSCQKKLKTVQ